MKKTLLILIIAYLGMNTSMSQDTIISYFDDQWKVVSKKKEAKYYRKEYFDNDKKLWAVNDYYLTDQIQMTGFYETQKKEVKHGFFTYFSENGQIKIKEGFMRGVNHGKFESWYENGNPYEFINFRYGKHHGEHTTYWENGQMRRKDIYENDSLLTGTVWDSLGVEADYYDYLTMPYFPGGQEALFRYISNNIRYPRKAKNRGIYGKVMLQFIVGKDGSILNIEVIKSVHRLLDEEAIRVIKGMPKWSPGTKEGEPVLVRYQVPINFKFQ